MNFKFLKNVLCLCAIAVIIVLVMVIEYELNLKNYNECVKNGGMKYSNSYAPLKCEINDNIYNNPRSVIHMVIYGANQ